jgi:hypothetical protein
MDMYCGNNYYEAIGKYLGTPYECLKKGVGAGLVGDLSNFNPNYRAIIPNDKYCGMTNVPQGMIQGTRTECLSKGYGIGLKKQYDELYGYSFFENDESTLTFRLIVLGTIIILALIFLKIIWALIIIGGAVIILFLIPHF